MYGMLLSLRSFALKLSTAAGLVPEFLLNLFTFRGPTSFHFHFICPELCNLTMVK